MRLTKQGVNQLISLVQANYSWYELEYFEDENMIRLHDGDTEVCIHPIANTKTMPVSIYDCLDDSYETIYTNWPVDQVLNYINKFISGMKKED